MRLSKVAILLGLLFVQQNLIAARIEKNYGSPEAKKIVSAIIKQNNKFINEHGIKFFNKISTGQKPSITLLKCSD